VGLGPSARAAWAAFWPSRLVVFGVAIWVTISGLDASSPEVSGLLSHPFGNWPAHHLLDLILSPLSKWDAKHFLTISYDGYGESSAFGTSQDYRPAFFPLYPGTVHFLSGFGTGPAAVLIVAYATSLACFFGALTLLHRLTTIEVGEQYAAPTLLLLSFFPTALFFGIPYSESMFLLLAVSAFLAARTGNWAVAGLVLALASATRVPGLLLLVPVLLLYLYGPRTDREPDTERGRRPRYRLRPDAAWLLLAPLGLVAFSAYLQLTLGDSLAWIDAQTLFGRHTVDPLTGAWAGIREAGKGLGAIADGSYQDTLDYLNVMQLVLTVFALTGGICALRVLPPAYGIWVLVSLVPSFVSQVDGDPLYSSSRFIVVLFPLFIWLAMVSEKRGWTTRLVALFAAGMAVFTAQFVLWSFVA
jgi:hypothetical protein